MKQINTEKAREYAENTGHSSAEFNANWWKYFSNYRLKKWKKELKHLTEKTGISLSDVSLYIGRGEDELPGFYRKLPKKRVTYIGIGMAYGLPLDTINRWLKKYGMKRQLYIKDVLNDLAWIYLIRVNDRKSSKNYFMMHEECLSVIEEEYCRMWNCLDNEYVPTEDVEDNMRYITEDEDHRQLRRFIEENIDSFTSAYAKPRKILNERVQMILDAKNDCREGEKKIRLNGLRGYLDDSMINYVSGGFASINTLDRLGKRTLGIKHIPKNRKTHISLCLALGMTSGEIDEYLELMGYAPLDAIDNEEGRLINEVRKWEEEHPLPRLFKEGLLKRPRDRAQAVNEMLMLRSDLKAAYEEQNEGKKFQYLSD